MTDFKLNSDPVLGNAVLVDGIVLGAVLMGKRGTRRSLSFLSWIECMGV